MQGIPCQVRCHKDSLCGPGALVGDDGSESTHTRDVLTHTNTQGIRVTMYFLSQGVLYAGESTMDPKYYVTLVYIVMQYQ